MFCLIVDKFGVEYVGKQHTDHLAMVHKKNQNITEDWTGKKYAGIDLTQEYNNRTCRSTVDGYIQQLRQKYDHPNPNNPKLSPHVHRPIEYGANPQISTPEDTSNTLDTKGINRLQVIFVVLQYVAREVKNKLLVDLSTIGIHQATATENANTAITQLLDYVATYPDDGILFRASGMVLAAHAYAGFLNGTKARSRSGAHIFLTEYVATPPLNGENLTIAKIIKPVIASASEAELAALYLTAKTMVTIRNKLEEMGWLQPKSPIQIDNYTAAGFTNNTIINKAIKTLDIKL